MISPGISLKLWACSAVSPCVQGVAFATWRPRCLALQLGFGLFEFAWWARAGECPAWCWLDILFVTAGCCFVIGVTESSECCYCWTGASSRVDVVREGFEGFVVFVACYVAWEVLLVKLVSWCWDWVPCVLGVGTVLLLGLGSCARCWARESVGSFRGQWASTLVVGRGNPWERSLLGVGSIRGKLCWYVPWEVRRRVCTSTCTVWYVRDELGTGCTWCVCWFRAHFLLLFGRFASVYRCK
jgi:hypothetical protein